MSVKVACMVGLGPPRQIDFADELQEILDQAVIATNGAGVTAAVVAEGQNPWTGAAGHSVRSANQTVPMTPDMLFEIGSVGKTFVTTLLMQLVDKGASLLFLLWAAVAGTVMAVRPFGGEPTTARIGPPGMLLLPR